jgi:uncharacterized protein (TIGR02246 family)
MPSRTPVRADHRHPEGMVMSHAVERILAELAGGWNAGDGRRLAAVFAEDATMVDVRGRVLNGRSTIADEHQALFDTIFRGATFTIDMLDQLPLADGLVLAHTTSVAQFPAGPRAGRNRGIQTLLVRNGEILAFHNTSCAD